MTGEIEQTDIARTQTLAEFANRSPHLQRRCIGKHDDVEAERAQLLAQRLSITRRVSLDTFDASGP